MAHALRTLQEIDVALDRVRASLASLDDGEAARRAAEAADAALELARASERAAAAELQDRELELRSTTDKAAKVERDLYGGAIRNPKELVALEEEIAALRRHQRDLEDRVLALMERAEDARREVTAGAADTEAARLRYEEAIAGAAAFRAALATEEAHLRPEREAVAAGIDEVLLRRYERRRVELGGLAVATIDGGTCSGCSIAVSPRLADRVAAGEAVTCERCGRILVADA